MANRPPASPNYPTDALTRVRYLDTNSASKSGRRDVPNVLVSFVADTADVANMSHLQTLARGTFKPALAERWEALADHGYSAEYLVSHSSDLLDSGSVFLRAHNTGLCMVCCPELPIRPSNGP